MTRFVLISDTHGRFNKLSVPDGDILIHAGDFGSHGVLSEVKEFNNWLESLPHKHKIFVAGNHDWCFESEKKESIKSLSAAIYLEDSAVKLEGFKIYGSPWQPRFFDWAFNLDRGEPLKKVWAKIPLDTDILITHGPPFGILDRVSRGSNAGCEDLARRLETVKPKLHVFGHIHEAYGEAKRDGIVFVNASVCDLNYQLRNEAIIIDL